MPRLLLPEDLPDAFHVAQARALGIGEGRLRGPDLERPFRGVRRRTPDDQASEDRLTPDEVERREVLARMRAYRLVMPARAFFVGATAAMALGIPLPLGLHGDLHVGVRHPGTAPRRAGIAGVQVLPRMVRVIRHGGFAVSSPASTWAMLGGVLGRYDLVAAADAILRVPRHPGGFRPPQGSALATRTQLAAALDAGRRRGGRDMRWALERARTGASSRPESWLRLILVQGGLPEPVLDHDVVGPHGEFLGCSELVYPAARVAVEYESDRHLTRAQLERDIDKYEAYAAIGWRIVRLTRTHIFTVPGEVVRRVRAALEAR